MLMVSAEAWYHYAQNLGSVCPPCMCMPVRRHDKRKQNLWLLQCCFPASPISAAAAALDDLRHSQTDNSACLVSSCSWNVGSLANPGL